MACNSVSSDLPGDPAAFEPMPSRAKFLRGLLPWPFLMWLAGFYSLWLVLVGAGGHWETLRAHWPIAVAMSFGSYIAGSTPMGGGTVGFPVLVLLFDYPGSLGRHFGLAVQSIGMVSASIFILSSRQPVEWKLLKPALFTAAIGTPMGAAWIAPHVPDLWVKLMFSVLWAGFGVMHLIKMKSIVAQSGISNSRDGMDCVWGIAVGLVGGVVASITGVGIDMMIYALLVLLYRADLKVAIPTSVILMAFSSLIGIGTNVALHRLAPLEYPMSPEVFANWLAAAPVVAIGAPFGAIVVRMISRTPTLILVSILCIGQFVWTAIDQRVTGATLVMSLGAIGVINLLFAWMYRAGRRSESASANGG